jgi:5-methylcytosine-specific restriction endonuclease McrA
MKLKKSKLQKKRDDHNSRLWRNKADNIWRKLVFIVGNGKCAVCGSEIYVQAHHMIPREMYSHRHAVMNGLAICASHHKYSFELSPHKAPVAFYKWLCNNLPNRWEWLLAQEPSRKNQITFKETFEIMSKEYALIETKQSKVSMDEGG